MTTRDRMRTALDAATASMDVAIGLMKELGRFEERDELIGIREAWTRAGYRCVRNAGPRGREAAPPIVSPRFTLKPPVRPRPQLRLVETGPTAQQLAQRVGYDAERHLRASANLLKRAKSELPDAG